jgi:hypothetical protein
MWENIDGWGSAVPIMTVALLMEPSLITTAAEGGEGLSTAC